MKERLIPWGAGWWLSAACSVGYTHGIEANGTTATVVTYPETGVAYIEPAKPQNDVSYNAFSRFDVDPAGAIFVNDEAQARTIVSEVFSTDPSRISGPVSVQGPRANLILANQNGLVVNGGSFVNFGSVALTTGSVSLRDVALTDGRIQRYVDLSTQGGTIRVEDGGLSGNLIRLELIAKELALAGNITNEFSSASAQTTLVAGLSNTSFDTVASPTDNLTPWAYHEAIEANQVPGLAQETTADFAIRVDATSTIASGRINVIVNQHGAGVRNAGVMHATHSHFSLSSTGDIVQEGGQLLAAGNLQLQGRSFHQTEAAEREAKVSGNGVTLIQVSGDIYNQGEIAGGMDFTAAAQSSEEAGEAAQARAPMAVQLHAGGQFTNYTATGAEQSSVVFSSVDGIAIIAHGGIHSSNSRIVSNGQLQLISEHGEITNGSRFIEGDGRVEWSSGGHVNRQRGYEIHYGQLEDDQHQGYWLAGGDMKIQGQKIRNSGGFVFSNGGQIEMSSAGSIENYGLNTGELAYRSKCFLFLCRQTASSSQAIVGGQIFAAHGITLQAQEQITNIGGQVYASEGNIDLKAPVTIAQGVSVHTVIRRPSGLKALFGDTWAQVYATDQGGSYIAQQGSLILSGQGLVERGRFEAQEQVQGNIEVIQAPHRDPVRLEDRLGILWW